jgi:hypothetical protein
MILDDGTAQCDRCSEPLAGYGVLNGLIADLGDRQLILCYVNECRQAAVDHLINFTGASVCSNTGQSILWATSEAILAFDLDPADPTVVRRLAFCRELGCADSLLTQTGIE